MALLVLPPDAGREVLRHRRQERQAVIPPVPTACPSPAASGPWLRSLPRIAVDTTDMPLSILQIGI